VSLKQEDLDGRYKISTASDDNASLPLQTDGVTVIVDGFTDRIDRHGCRWTTRLTLVDPHTVKLVTTADPLEADPDFMLTGQDGRPTRKAVEYSALLKASRKNGRLRLSGGIEYGRFITVLTMMKI
jgi:hypothetical protein